MEPKIQPTPVQRTSASKTALWTGSIISALPVLILVFSASMKFAKPEAVVKGFADLGWPERLATPLGIVEITCALLYLIPRTSILGAILVTGYLGGATATHVRIGQPFFLPILLGVLVWLGLFFRDRRVRALIPLRS